MNEARFLLRFPNSSGWTPRDRANLERRCRSLVEAQGGRVVNLRVTPVAVEFDLFCAPDPAPAPDLSALAPFGKPLTVKPLGGPPRAASAQEIVEEAQRLWKERRFWEVHETLEDLWKTLKGRERAWVQALIIAAAAFVHHQRDEDNVAWRMFEDAARRLDDAPEAYEGIDLRRFRGALAGLISRRKMDFIEL